MKTSYSRCILIAGVFVVGLFVLHAHLDKPRALSVGEVPVAFWGWRTNAPSQSDVDKVFKAANAKTLFLRTGQFDLVNGNIKRIREVAGTLATRVELHFVYNGTRDFLDGWEQLDTSLLADEIAGTYRADLARAVSDSADVRGLQLDLDVPTRLLPRYAKTLQALRVLLPPDTTLSITGLPTWTDANEIELVLGEVDFWIPQFYGGKIPRHVDQRMPISSAQNIERAIKKVRRLNKPYYAGLSAYGYAILYGRDGSVMELRGNIDPTRAALEPKLKLLDKSTFAEGNYASEIRYEYQAQEDLVLDGLIVNRGETLVFDVPTSASLRAGAQVVRETAGERLLGICMFRLPSDDDLTNLTMDEITAALSDIQTIASTTLNLVDAGDREFLFRGENDGSARSGLGGDAFAVDLDIEAGSIARVSGLSGFAAYETLCRSDGRGSGTPCSPNRANVIRLTSTSWRPGDVATARINLNRDLPPSIAAMVTVHIDDGRVERSAVELRPMKSGDE